MQDVPLSQATQAVVSQVDGVKPALSIVSEPGVGPLRSIAGSFHPQRRKDTPLTDYRAIDILSSLKNPLHTIPAVVFALAAAVPSDLELAQKHRRPVFQDLHIGKASVGAVLSESARLRDPRDLTTHDMSGMLPVPCGSSTCAPSHGLAVCKSRRYVA